MQIKDITELLKQAYMEEQWDSVLECINLLNDYEENKDEDPMIQHNYDETDF
tara:strand:- start:63 stop:218 length:156 start_codon:yes stop_codon:yes gene_type:complete